MNITIEDIAKIQNNKLTTVTSKLIYLIIKNSKKDEEGYIQISIKELMNHTGISRRQAARIIAGMLVTGLIEKKTDKIRANETNSYRTIDY